MLLAMYQALPVSAMPGEFPRVAEILLAAPHGHVSVLRQRASANSKRCQCGFNARTLGLGPSRNSALGRGCYAPVARALAGLAFSCQLPEALRAALLGGFSRDAEILLAAPSASVCETRMFSANYARRTTAPQGATYQWPVRSQGSLLVAGG